MRAIRSSACLLAAVALFWAGSAQAVLVTNVTTDTTLFYDDFEGMGAAVSHTTWPDATGDYDPTGGAPGSWTIDEWDVSDPPLELPDKIQVTDSTTSPDPGAHQGSNYLRAVRPGPGPTNAQADFALQEAIDDVLHAEFMLYTPSGLWSETAQVLLHGPGGYAINVVCDFNGFDNRVVRYSGGFAAIPELDGVFVNDQWQKWEIDYVIGQSTFDLTIDGVTALGVTMQTPGVSVDKVIFTQGNRPPGYPFYVDAVGSDEPLLGDFNGDGNVDTADYTIWADNYTGSGGSGGTPSTGDANGDGAVDTADYTIWADNYTGSSGAASRVPEPSVLILVGIGAWIGFVTRGGRRRN